jgi:hypothetical protein
MRFPLSIDQPRTAASWPACLSLCLALLLLYNPFFAAPSPAHGLHYRHPLRNRATIGASELQGFSPVEQRDALSAPPALDLALALTFPEPSSQMLHLNPVGPFVSFVCFGFNLWFRPPPSR